MSKLIIPILLLLISAKCTTGKYKYPEGEQCIIGTNSSQCYDPTLQKDDRSYDKEFYEIENYSCVKSSYLAKLKIWALENRIERIKCERLLSRH